MSSMRHSVPRKTPGGEQALHYPINHRSGGKQNKLTNMLVTREIVYISLLGLT